MDFTYDDEQEALREAVRGLVGKAYADFEQRRQTVKRDPGFDEALWGRLAEMGVLGLPFAEDDGGMGAGPIEVGIVAQELGRVLAPEPFLTSVVLAGGLVAAAGSAEQRAEVLGALSAGESVLAFAHAEPGSRWEASATAVSATQSEDSWTLTGVKEPVPHGARADLLVVSAALPDGGTGLFLVSPEGVARDGYPTHDGGRAARISFDATPATPLGVGGDATAHIESATAAAVIAAANEAVGAMQVALPTTTEYLTSRKQFGVPLNTFQSLSFRAADMYVSLELAQSVALWASMVLDADPASAQKAAARAGLQVSRAGRHIGQEAIQLHGGIGMTAEYSIGSYTSHLTALDHLLGDGNHHLAALSSAVGGYAEADPLP
ncbi:acyl-CoA dehydrogenase family protein [Nocardioides donggukensis]|uniref:Acyl-CoA dehydrogenase family protein n=1 Tax=Nocardioides donggukensis TaxID=2774019 RepID=A0A927K7F8_9ACTN|nr:acyl-CoA dehydrogenase [Nocardioides donggukensis]MBD8870560.1 acyl-CoA dehydrogenase family protein [Nocardioides donggukensis]